MVIIVLTLVVVTMMTHGASKSSTKRIRPSCYQCNHHHLADGRCTNAYTTFGELLFHSVIEHGDTYILKTFFPASGPFSNAAVHESDMLALLKFSPLANHVMCHFRDISIPQQQFIDMEILQNLPCCLYCAQLGFVVLASGLQGAYQ